MRKFTGGQLNGTNSQVVPRNGAQEAQTVGREARERKVYRRPILDIEQRGPINRILEDQYNYLLQHDIPASKRDVNQNMDQTLLVWEFINGEDTMPRAYRISEDTQVVPPTEPPVTGGGRRRRSRKTRKSKKSTR